MSYILYPFSLILHSVYSTSLTFYLASISFIVYFLSLILQTLSSINCPLSLFYNPISSISYTICHILYPSSFRIILYKLFFMTYFPFPIFLSPIHYFYSLSAILSPLMFIPNFLSLILYPLFSIQYSV